MVLVCTQLGRIPNGLNELVANAGSLHIKVHEEVGLRQSQDGGGRNVHNVCHLAVRCLSGNGLIEFSAARLVSPLDLDTGVCVLKFLDLLGEEVAEVGLETLSLEGDFTFDLRGVDLRIVEIRCGNIAGNIRLGDRTRCRSATCGIRGRVAAVRAGAQPKSAHHGQGDNTGGHPFLQHAKPPLVRVVDRYEYRITNYLVLVDKARLPLRS